MGKVIKNPVSNNPWTPDMPNNFRGCEAANKKLPEPVYLNMKTNPRRPRKASTRLQLTQIYADQLAPLYPFLNKTQVKSALTLAKNNLYQSRLLLDLVNKFLKVEPLNLAISFYSKESSERFTWESKSNTDANTSTATLHTSVEIKSFGSDTSGSDNSTNHTSTTQSELENSSTASSKSDLSVYEFGQTEYNYEPIQSWSSHKKQVAKKKVGVSIVRCKQGYKAFLL